MTIWNFFLTIIESYPELSSFFGVILTGEPIVFSMGIFVSSKSFLIQKIYLFLVLGTLSSDFLWFYIGRNHFSKIIRWERFFKHVKKIDVFTHRITKNAYFRLLLISKFVYGTRILSLIHISQKNISFLRFMIYNAVVTSIWVFVVMSAGWLTGKGIVTIKPFLNTFQIIISVIIIFLFVFTFLRLWAKDRINQEQNLYN